MGTCLWVPFHIESEVGSEDQAEAVFKAQLPQILPWRFSNQVPMVRGDLLPLSVPYLTGT